MDKTDTRRELYRASAIAAQRNRYQSRRIDAQEVFDSVEVELKRLETMVCAEAGVSTLYLPLIRQVIESPLYGIRVPKFSKIRENAFSKGVIIEVKSVAEFHLSDGHGSASNSWIELGPLGIQIMRDLNGPEWKYSPPSARMEEWKQNSQPEDMPLPGMA